MGKMYDLNTCSVCKVGRLIPTGNTLDEFKCDNSYCQQRVIDKNTFESINSGEDLDMTHYRDEDGE